MKNLEKLAKYLADPIRKYVDKAISPIIEKVKEIESQKINIKEIIDQIPIPKDGKNGSNGKDGINGKDGKDGKNGSDGTEGKQGKNGLDGINGKDGLDGKSFIDQLPELGFTNKDEFISSIKGKDGHDGKDGINGINGKDGKDGINGKSFIEQLPELGFTNKDEFISSIKGKDGHDGKDGINGINGKDGKDGINGINGKDGLNGHDGKDALQIELLPSIDESKSYDRGTYAKHRNGIFRSFEKTNGMRGWECIVAGIDSIEVEQTEDRKFSIKMTKSDGNEVNKEFFMPVMIYKGVYKEDHKYVKGDTVTWGGSIWHCNQDTCMKPDNVDHKHWTLAAKRGRDAK